MAERRDWYFRADFCYSHVAGLIYNWFWEEGIVSRQVNQTLPSKSSAIHPKSRLKQYAKLIIKLGRIYFSNEHNKDTEYRRTIFYELKSWGGVYIKFLQIIAGMSKFMAGWSGPAEMTVFSQSPFEEINLSNYVNLDNFLKVSPTPFAAGSFAQVYRGVLKNGEEVVIKILRPSIDATLKHDLKILRRLCWIFTKFLPKYVVDYNEAYDTCAKMFLRETNYDQERENQKYFAKLYENNLNVKIPKVYDELSNQKVIVQEFIAGPTLSDVMSMATPSLSATALTKQLTGSDLWQQVITAGGEALYMAMCADYVFGDPHPGNIVLLKENRIAFVDFGVVAEKPASHYDFAKWIEVYAEIIEGKAPFSKLLEATVTCFVPDMAIAMRRLVFDDGDLLKILADSVGEKLEHEMKDNQNFVELFANGHLMDVLLQVLSTKVIEVDIKQVNFELIKAMQAFLGSITILDNNESRGGFSDAMLHAVRYALAAAERTGITHDSVTMTRMTLTDSYELVINTLSSLASADEMVFQLVRERIFV